ncbi:hypothetical protein ACRAWD_07485 [Caulobacter segnis]
MRRRRGRPATIRQGDRIIDGWSRAPASRPVRPPWWSTTPCRPASRSRRPWAPTTLQNGPFRVPRPTDRRRRPGKPRRPLHRRPGPGGNKSFALAAMWRGR